MIPGMLPCTAAAAVAACHTAVRIPRHSHARPVLCDYRPPLLVGLLELLRFAALSESLWLLPLELPLRLSLSCCCLCCCCSSPLPLLLLFVALAKKKTEFIMNSPQTI